MKKLTYLVWALVAGIVFSFAMTIYTGVSEHKARQAQEQSAQPIPLPAR